ncbi:MAG: response regulator transcription factor [SAR202 cluster bacterium]|nr:response regulator transcription factor [SAR202 cluster bacterium]
MRVLVLNHGQKLADLVTDLETSGFSVQQDTETSLTSLAHLEHSPDLVLLHEEAPRVDEAPLVTTLRNSTSCPIVVIGNGSSASLPLALLQGADAYLTYPVHQRELAARLHSLVRRSKGRWQERHDTPTGRTGGDSEFEHLFAQLTRTERRLFGYLLARANRLVSREELLAQVWGPRGRDNSLRFYVFQLRRKVRTYCGPDVEIVNRSGTGYVLKVYRPVDSAGDR